MKSPFDLSTPDAVQCFFESRSAALNLSVQKGLRMRTRLNVIFCVIFIVFVGCVLLSVVDPSRSPIYALISLGCGIYVAIVRSKAGRQTRKDGRLVSYYEECLGRVHNGWRSNQPSGIEFREPGHLFDEGIEVLGDGSLFQRLCTVRTKIGQRALAQYLLSPVTAHDARARQAAVLELRSRNAEREDIALLGSHRFVDANHAAFQELPEGQIEFSAVMKGIAFAGTYSTLFFALLLFTHLLPIATSVMWSLPTLAMVAVIGVINRERVATANTFLGEIRDTFFLLDEGLKFLASRDYSDPKLASLVASARRIQESVAILQMRRLITWSIYRNKDWLYPVSRLLLAGSHISIVLGRWLAVHPTALDEWAAIWGEYEALSALAAYSFENPHDCFPQIIDGQPRVSIKGMGHPLLARGTVVRNNVELGGEHKRLIVLSGSNMSGKSTFLRALGSNMILAMAGGPLCATKASVAPIALCASTGLRDSQLDGISRFRAEVELLARATELVRKGSPLLFLVDEIFSGTNSIDRLTASEMLLKVWVGGGCMGIISTHDLALTEIAALFGSKAANAHFQNISEDNPLQFDYLLRPGVSTLRNGIAVARLIGLETPDMATPST